MAALGSQSIASSYEQLLHVDADGGGNSTTHVSVKDGDNGTTFALTLATDAVMITSDNRLEFGDTGTYIHQSANGVLDLVSDTEIEINATTIDMNGAVDISGDITMAEKLIHESDADTYIQMQTDRMTFLAGAVEFIDFAETTQDRIFIGAASDVDVKLIGGSGTIFIQGSNGYIGIGDITPTAALDCAVVATFRDNVLVNSTNYALEGYATGRNVLRHTLFRLEPGNTANTNLKTTSTGSFNKPSITDAGASDDATSLGKNETEGSWTLNSAGSSLTLNLTETVIEILSISITIMDLNSSSTTRYNIDISVSSGNILFLINATGAQTNLDWTAILDAGDAVQFHTSYITSS